MSLNETYIGYAEANIPDMKPYSNSKLKHNNEFEFGEGIVDMEFKNHLWIVEGTIGGTSQYDGTIRIPIGWVSLDGNHIYTLESLNGTIGPMWSRLTD